MNLKKSNREGTGKKHKCLYCDNMIPFYKKYCNKQCYNNDKNIIITCKCCKQEKKIPKNRKSTIYCSKQCANKSIDRKKSHYKAQQTLKQKYGVENPFEVIGYDNIQINYQLRAQHQLETINNRTKEESQRIGNKISQSLINKTPEEKQKIENKKQETNLTLYGDKYSLGKNSLLRIKADIKRNEKFVKNLNKWLEENNLELLDKYTGVKTPTGEIQYYTFKHLPSNTIFIDHMACGRMPMYKDPNLSIGTSNAEKEIQKFIKENIYSEVICNNKKLVKGFEIDIYIPEYKLAIEFNGLKWHSELNGKNREYHIYKTNECNKQGIQLIHIFEDEWRYKQDIIKSKILNLIGKTPNKIYARKCEIKPVNNNDKNIFLNNTHIQGEDKSLYKYGLYYNNELISIITFGNLRKITGNKAQNNTYELIRFSTRLNTNVIGGFSKLLKYFIKQHQPRKIISYADKRYSTGKLYINNGFIYVNDTPPNYWYMKYYNKREHRFAYRKSILSKKIPNFNSELSEWENMKNNKYDRIWDCGSIKFEINL